MLSTTVFLRHFQGNCKDWTANVGLHFLQVMWACCSKFLCDWSVINKVRDWKYNLQQLVLRYMTSQKWVTRSVEMSLRILRMGGVNLFRDYALMDLKVWKVGWTYNYLDLREFNLCLNQVVDRQLTQAGSGQRLLCEVRKCLNQAEKTKRVTQTNPGKNMSKSHNSHNVFVAFDHAIPAQTK